MRVLGMWNPPCPIMGSVGAVQKVLALLFPFEWEQAIYPYRHIIFIRSKAKIERHDPGLADESGWIAGSSGGSEFTVHR